MKTKVWIIARHDLKMALNDKGGMLWMFVLPVVFAIFFGLVSRGGPAPADAKPKLTVVNADTGFLGECFLAELRSMPFILEELTAKEAATATGKIRTLVIPADFTSKIQNGERVTLKLEKDPDTSMEAGYLVETRLYGVIAKFLSRLIQLGTLRSDQPLTLERFMSIEQPNDLVTVDSRYAGRKEHIPGGFEQSIPANMVMFVMLVTLTYGAASLTVERSQGMLRRLTTAPLSHGELVMGKILGRMLIASLQIIVLTLFTIGAGFMFDLKTASNPLAMILILLIYASAVAPLGILFGSWFKDPDRAASVGVLATLLMAAFGGCWWPIEIVSPFLQKFALVFPTGWAMKALHQIISFGYGISSAAIPLAVLAIYAIVFTAAARRAVRVE